MKASLPTFITLGVAVYITLTALFFAASDSEQFGTMLPIAAAILLYASVVFSAAMAYRRITGRGVRPPRPSSIFPSDPEQEPLGRNSLTLAARITLGLWFLLQFTVSWFVIPKPPSDDGYLQLVAALVLSFILSFLLYPAARTRRRHTFREIALFSLPLSAGAHIAATTTHAPLLICYGAVYVCYVLIMYVHRWFTTDHDRAAREAAAGPPPFRGKRAATPDDIQDKYSKS